MLTPFVTEPNQQKLKETAAMGQLFIWLPTLG